MRVIFASLLWAALLKPALAIEVTLGGPLLTQSLQIPVGGSVSGFDAFALATSTDQDVLDYLQSAFPGNYVVLVSTSDRDGNVQLNISAPGSSQGIGMGTYWCVSFQGCGSPNPPLKFTYNSAGLYRIDYTYTAFANIYPIDLIFDSPDMNELIAGPFFGTVFESTAGGGYINVAVGSVPEPATWFMILVGLFGVIVLSCSSKIRDPRRFPDSDLALASPLLLRSNKIQSTHFV